MDQTYMKEKPVVPLVISMALPMTISMLVNALYNIVDSYFVAKISEDAMTALSLVFPIQNLVTAVTVGFAIGINAVISFYLGAKKNNLASSAASLGILLNALHGLLLTIVCLGGLRFYLGLFTDSEAVISLAMRYCRITLMFCVPISLAMSFEKIFQSVGRMTASMFCMLCGCVANIILDPLLIFGVGIFPRLGIEGAAVATCIGELIPLLIYTAIYFKRGLPVKINFAHIETAGALTKRLYAIGIPATLNLALPSLLISALNGILAAYSGAYVLVLGAYYKLQTFLYLTANGVVQGMRPLLGYNYGAGEHKRVNKIFNAGLIIIALVMVVGTMLCLVIPGTLIGLFTENAETVAAGVGALRIISIGFIVSSVSVTASGALEGLGKGMDSLIISVLRYVVVILPLALILSRFFGADGVWHAFWTTEFITAAVAFIIYRRALKR